MGAQIAAHLANAGLQVWLFDLAKPEGDSRAIANQALAQLKKLQPAPLALPELAARIRPADYQHDLAQLRDCQWVIEAIAERLDWKSALYQQIAPYLAHDVLLCSNTSGLSLASLSAVLPAALRPRFCGVHFFNPPRYMPLVELIPAPETRPELLDQLESVLTSGLGKSVVRAYDTPNFIANRIGVFSIVACLHHAERLQLAPDVVDALTGPVLGRPKSATYRTADVVGLDTLAHVVEGSAPALAHDPWVQYLQLPAWLHTLIKQGALGQKAGAGVFRKNGKQIEVFDPSLGHYRPAHSQIAPEVAELLKIKPATERLYALRNSSHPQAQFLWAVQRDVWHYASVCLAEIAETARDLDLALRWGFGWKQGPFELWQAAGWSQLAEWMADDIAHGRSMSRAPLPEWVTQLTDGVHTASGSWSAAQQRYLARRALPVYQRQRFPELLLGEAASPAGRTISASAAARLWSDDDGVLVLSLHSKMHTLGSAVLSALEQALDYAEQQQLPLVIWQSAPFSAGADLSEFAPLIEQGLWQDFTHAVQRFQATMLRVRNARVPVVAAVQGLALGGGCELTMHCQRVVAALESQFGLPEAGVGLIPAGGGCKELLYRTLTRVAPADALAPLQQLLNRIAKGQISANALQAQQWDLLRASDVLVLNPHEVLHIAKSEARALAATLGSGVRSMEAEARLAP